MDLPVMPPVAPMLAKPVGAIPDGGYVFEPKWDGFRSIIFRDGAEVEIGSRNERPMTRYFPELVDAVLAELPSRCVIDGEVVVPDFKSGRLDFEALQLRIHPAASRVRLLAEQTPAHFVAFDLLALDGTDYTAAPFRERRAVLERALAAAASPIHLTPITSDAAVAREWFGQFEGAGLDGLIAKSPEGVYEPDKRVMLKIKHERTADCVVAGYRPHKSGDDAIGSLLLGLHRPDGVLASVGVVGAFPMEMRRALRVELEHAGVEPGPAGPCREQPGGVVEIAPRLGDVGGRVVAGGVLVPGDHVSRAEGLDHVECPVPARETAVPRFGGCFLGDSCRPSS